jgi:Flp pilus assembly protein TadG
MIRRALADTRGAAAVEAAIVLPVMMVLLMGIGEFGQATMQKERMQAAVNAGIELALQGADNANDTGGSALGISIAKLVRDHGAGGNGTATVTVNNGVTAVAPSAGGTPTTSGTAANAAQCYCPTGSAASLTWGATASCGTACAGGGTAGRFVVVALALSRTPIFPAWTAIGAPTRLAVAAVVRVK